MEGGGSEGVANAATQKVNASLRAVEQVAGTMGLDLDEFLKRATRVAVPAGSGD